MLHVKFYILKTKHPGLDDFQNLVSKIFSDFRMLPSYLLSSMYNCIFVAHNNQISIRFLFTCKNKMKIGFGVTAHVQTFMYVCISYD